MGAYHPLVWETRYVWPVRVEAASPEQAADAVPVIYCRAYEPIHGHMFNTRAPNLVLTSFQALYMLYRDMTGPIW